MKIVTLKNASSTSPELQVKYCTSFFSKLLGLMFTNDIQQEEGIILVEDHESKINTAIHMAFMNYDITVLWLDKNLVIVDKALAKRWRPMYVPSKPAQYVVELHQELFSKFNVGDKLILSESP